MQKLFLIIAASLGALSVMVGAFGAHALRATLEAQNRLDTFETAVKYQFYHVFALLGVSLLLFHFQSKWLGWAGYAFVGGIFIFSGSLYILCLTGNTKWGAVTPFGGLLFIAGWGFLLMGIIKEM